MRSYSLLLLVLGAVASDPFFPSGKEYEFYYKGKFMTGIPELDESHFAGLSMEGKVILQAKSSQNFKLSLKDMRFNKFNEQLTEVENPEWRRPSSSRDEDEPTEYGTEPLNWRNLKTPETQQVPSEYQAFLESPIEFSMINGEISQIQVSNEEPEWSVNFKKALVSLMKVQTNSGHHDDSINSIRVRDSYLPKFWKIMEEGVDGKCENVYTVSELPEYMLQEVTSKIVLDTQKCEGKKVFEILKTRNVNKCVERASFQLNQPGKFLCLSGNCNSMFERSSMTRYIACGSSMDNMELQVILNEGELQQDLLAFNTESLVTGTKQTLKMVEIRSSLTTLPQIISPKTLEDLFYEYPQNIKLQGKNVRDMTSFRDQQENLQNNPVTLQRFEQSLDDSVLAKISPETLKQKIIERLTQVSKDLREVEDIAEKNIAQNILSIRKVFSLLNTEQMKSLYSEVKGLNIDPEDKETVRQLVLEISVTSGTSPAVMFIKDMIQNNEFSPLRIGVTLSTLPHYIQTPTVELLDQFFELVKSPAVTRNWSVKANAQLAFATLVNRACIDSYRVSRFPVFVFGEFCNSQTSEITTKYIPYFVDQLQSNDNKERESAILSLGTLGHESVIPILLPYIEGKTERITPLEQRFAIYSLVSVSHVHRDILLPIYSAITHNPSEDRDVRIATLSVMLKLRPSLAYFQKLATSTWFEKDNEFHKFVYSTLRSLSDIENPEHPNYDQAMFSNSQKARTVLNLAKPLPSVISSTLNYFTAEWLKKLEVGYHFQGFMSTTKIIQQIYVKFDYFLEQLKFSPIEFCFNMHGTGELINTINRILALETYARSIKDSVLQPSSLKQKVCGTTPFNFVKVNNPAPTEILIPSDMGMPILIDFQMPTVAYAKGEINIDCSSSSIPSVSLKVSHKSSAAFRGYVGTICPFSNEIIVAGVDQHSSVNVPAEISTKIEMGKLKLVLTRSNDIKPSTQSVDLWSYTVKPFATIKPLVYLDVTPVSSHQNTKIIRSGSEEKEERFSIGTSLGLDCEKVITSETDILDRKSLMDYLSLYKYNPINMMLFSWTHTAMRMDGKPSIRQHSVKMVFNPSKSSTSEVEVNLSMGLAQKIKNKSPHLIQIIRSLDQDIQVRTQQLQSAIDNHQKLQMIFQNIDVEEGYGLNANLEITMRGKSQKTMSYSLSAGAGSKGVDQKWNINLEDSERMSICIDGKMVTPIISLRSADKLSSENVIFSYANNIGFGKTCQEHTIKVTGTTNVSDVQKQTLQKSESSRKCKEYTLKVDQLRKQLEKTSQMISSDLKQLQKKLRQAITEKDNNCRQEILEQTSLDKVNFRIQYSPMPENVVKYARYVDIALKGLLVPFMSRFEERSLSNEINVDINFNIDVNTIDLLLTTEDGTISYENIRLPENMRSLLPLNAHKNVLEQVATSIIGESVYPECSVGNSFINTFDNKTYNYELDDCYHVLASDCSKDFTHAVLGKKTNEKMEIIIFTLGSKMEMKPSQSYTEQRKDYEITVDEQSVPLSKGEKVEVDSVDKRSSYRLERSSDDVVIVETPYSRITYDAMEVSIEHTKLSADIKHCGLCGDSNGDLRADVKTAQSCVAQTPQVAALSFRDDKHCTSGHKLQQQLQQQQQQQQRNLQQITCKPDRIEKAPVTQNLKGQLDKCSQMKHSMVRQADKQGERLCISHTPIIECGNGCAPRSMITKQVVFTCLPAGRDRVMRLYEEKVRRGDILPELKNMEATFSAQLEHPVSCTHPGL